MVFFIALAFQNIEVNVSNYVRWNTVCSFQAMIESHVAGAIQPVNEMDFDDFGDSQIEIFLGCLGKFLQSGIVSK